MSVKHILDSSSLLTAAEAIEREAAVVNANVIDDQDAVDALTDLALQFRAIALAAAQEPTTKTEGHGWPAIEVLVQATADMDEFDGPKTVHEQSLVDALHAARCWAVASGQDGSVAPRPMWLDSADELLGKESES